VYDNVLNGVYDDKSGEIDNDGSGVDDNKLDYGELME